MARVLKRESARRDMVAQRVWYAENAGVEIGVLRMTQRPQIGSPIGAALQIRFTSCIQGPASALLPGAQLVRLP